MNIKKLLLGVLIVAIATFLIRISRFVYYHTIADQRIRLKYELCDFHYARFFLIHARILNMHNGKVNRSDEFELKCNREMMIDEGYADQEISLMELDAKNAAIREWIKK